MKEDVRIELGNVTNNPGLITSLFEDPQNNLWIGTTTGLFVYRIYECNS
ncbi:MAG: two-component regulator propeller domain-containing protein [Bacteroides cellulosilyticus]